MIYMPAQFWLVVVFVFGLIIGSFLNVLIYRLHTGKSLNDRSHCLSCGETLTWYDLFPVFSYLFLFGRCRRCGSYIPYRYLLVELLTASMFVVVWLKTTDVILYLLLATLVAVLIIGVVYDLYHMIIPNEIVFLTFILGLLVVIYENHTIAQLPNVGLALLSSALAFSFFGGLWWFSKGTWIGFGDAKLAIGLGLLTGLAGVFSMVVLSFWLGAILSVLIIFIQTLINRGQRRLHFFSGELTMKSEIPFAPFLVLAFVLVYFLGADVLSLTGYAIQVIFNTFI
jgi:leader peptidase (prepilin peptidase) / N-methyltransferase